MDGRRVSDAGASVRRVRHTIRPQEIELTLVAYVFTNEDGEFVLPLLPQGEYRLNLQYPGYPMDESSFITIPIGEGVESQVRVAASVVAEKINVKKVVITGLWEEEGYEANVFPNPTANFVKLKFDRFSATRNVKLIDVNGRKMVDQSIPEKEASIDVRTFSEGTYIIHVSDQNEIRKTVRLVITR